MRRCSITPCIGGGRRRRGRGGEGGEGGEGRGGGRGGEGRRWEGRGGEGRGGEERGGEGRGGEGRGREGGRGEEEKWWGELQSQFHPIRLLADVNLPYAYLHTNTSHSIDCNQTRNENRPILFQDPCGTIMDWEHVRIL